MTTDPKTLLADMFRAATTSALPASCVPPHLPPAPKGRTVVVGAGKAAASMARAVEENWQGPISGLVVTRYGHNVPCERIEVVEASHPVPDAAGEEAARRILELASSLGPDDLLLCLISGGGSALMALPAPGLTMADKQAVSKALLKSGASITEMNCVRKHLSAIKGGRLAVATKAQLVSLVISDVPGDDPSAIASGPTVPDPTTFADALAIVEKYDIQPPESVMRHLREGKDETPKPGDPRLSNARMVMVATPQMALESAAEVARKAGYETVILGNAIEGEAREVAMVHAGITRQVLQHGQPGRAPCVLLSGGETTVTVRGQGRGGRNAEFLLALTVALDGVERVYALAADTDGVDGTEDNAGAITSPDTLARAAAKGLNAKEYLRNNDGYSFFSGLGDLVITGPTLTNVNDFRAIIIEAP
jgi:hydroxypyruvate reductase